MVLQFMSYLRKTWLPAANNVFVYGYPVRINNIVERFHNTISKKFGSRHPNVWIFIENLKKVIIDQAIDLSRLQNNLQARRTQTRANRERNNIILQKQKDLVEHRLPLNEFLDLFSRFYETYLYNMDMIDEEIITHENNDYEVCTNFLSKNFNSMSEETLRITSCNININTAGDSLTLTQRQDSVENERLFSQILRNRYPAAQEELFASENATSTDIIIDIDGAEFISASPVTMGDAYNQNTNSILNLPRFDNDEFDDEHIYTIPEDDFGYWYKDQENIVESDIPYHEVKRLSLETCKENQGAVRFDRTCTACINAESNQVFIPCGHICYCEDCANHIMRESDNVKKCSICKGEVSSVYKVYIS